MKHQGLAWLAALCLVLCPAGTLAHAAASPSLHTLNGIRVVLESDSLAMGVDVAVWYPPGWRPERSGLAGASHLVERLMYRGSAAVPDGDHRRRLLAEGAVVNTQMSPDYACYWQTVPGEALALALQLEAARMQPGPHARGVRGRAPRGARRRSRAGRTPGGDTRARPPARPAVRGPGLRPRAAGQRRGPGQAAPAQVEAWRRGAYAPGSAVITIVGRFDREATLDAVRRLFEGLPRGAAAAPPVWKAPAPGERRGWGREDTPAHLLLAGWRAPGAADPDAPAMELLAQVLGSGRTRACSARSFRSGAPPR